MWLAGAIPPPRKLKPQKVEPRRPGFAAPTERNNTTFGGGQLQSELFQAKLHRTVKVLRFILMFECANKIVCVSNQARLASTVLFCHFVKPQIQRVVQVHVGQNW